MLLLRALPFPVTANVVLSGLNIQDCDTVQTSNNYRFLICDAFILSIVFFKLMSTDIIFQYVHCVVSIRHLQQFLRFVVVFVCLPVNSYLIYLIKTHYFLSRFVFVCRVKVFPLDVDDVHI